MSNSCELSIYFHHGGRIIYVGRDKEYSGGELRRKHGLDMDRFGFFDLVEEVENLRYTSWDNLYFKDPKTGEFKELNDDREVMKMISFVTNGDKFVNVYVDNGKRTGKETDIHNHHGEVTKEVVDVGNIYSRPSLRENFAADDDEGSISEDNDYIPTESSDTEDGLDDDELVSDDEEYIEARQNMKNFKVVIDDGKGNKCNEIVHIDTYGADGEIMSEYEESDGNINSKSSEDEDGAFRRFKLQKVTYDPKCDHKSLKIVLGMRFQDGFQCKRALRTNAIENGNPIRFIRCNARQCEARCIPECNWRCYGSVVKSDGHFVIKTLGGPHTCPRVMNNKLATTNWVATELLEIFRTRPDIKIKELATHIMNRYGCDVSVPKLYRARLKAQENLRGTLIEHYGKLRNYVAELLKVDKEGWFELLVYENIFKAFYVGFSALKKGFLRGCRRIIGLDGCFLKTLMRGVLLCDIAKDGNNQMYPTAWAVVEVENQDCWSWFLKILLDELGITDGLGYTFISDQQKGLTNALIELAPHAEHRNCARHVYCNWKKQFKGPTLKNLFWRATRSTYVAAYKKALEDMKVENKEAYLNFIERDPSKFCKAHKSVFPKCDMVDNNISETFNGFIVKAREKPLIDMLQDIRCKLMERQYKKLNAISGLTDRICPAIRAKLEKLKLDCLSCTVIPAIGEKFEVCLQDDRFVVNVPNRTCTCRLWDLTGIPCIHACRALHFLKVDAANFVDDCYSVQRYLDAYRYGIEPLDGLEMWVIAQRDRIEPPLVRKLPGRPPKKRKRGLEEKETRNSSKLRSFGLQMTCRRCQQSGHNKRTCKNPPVELPQPGNTTRDRKSNQTVGRVQKFTPRRKSNRQATNANVRKERALVNTELGVATFEGTRHIYMKMSCVTQVHHVNSKRGGIQAWGRGSGRAATTATTVVGERSRDVRDTSTLERGECTQESRV